MDETVIKTDKLNYRVYQFVLKKIYQIGLTKDDWNEFFSGKRPKESITDYLQKKYKIDFNIILYNRILKQLRHQKNKELEKFDIKVIDGFYNLVKNLRNNKYKVALATSTVKNYVKIFTRRTKIEQFFDFIVTGEDINIGKPNPEIYVTTMKHFNINPEKTVIFEDSKAGILAAKMSGATVIKIGSNSRLINNSHIQIRDYKELLNL